jgi:8-oxo-dGTP diphosphatase
MTTSLRLRVTTRASGPGLGRWSPAPGIETRGLRGEEAQVAEVDSGARPGCGAAALFVDSTGEVLIVEPTDKATWEIPGVQVQRGETPREACVRALHDQLALDVAPGRLLVVDWAPFVREERVRFVFDGGELTDEQLEDIELAPELTSWAFLPPEELFVMVEPRLVRRVTAALAARAAGITTYLEGGERVDLAADGRAADGRAADGRGADGHSAYR